MTTERKQSETANGYNGRTDVFFSDVYGEYKYEGFTDKAFRYIEDFQLLDAELWRRFVQQFREHSLGTTLV